MFEVRAQSPFDEVWEERQESIFEAAGRRSDFSGAGITGRDHGWYVADFDEAVAMKDRLCGVADVTATVRESAHAKEADRG